MNPLNLAEHARSGFRWASLGQFVTAVLQLAQVAVLGRFLPPSDFGLLAMAFVVIGFAQLFSDLGISASIIHYQNVTQKQLSSLYWFNVFFGTLIAGSLILIAPSISTFYGEPKIAGVLRALTSLFVIGSIGNQFKSLNQRSLRFDIIAKIDIASAATGLLVGALAAQQNFGVYSLVFSAIASALISTSGNLLTALSLHRPSLHFAPAELKHFFQFGFFRTGENIINFFNSQLDIILIGRILGTDALGYYTIGKNLCMKPVTLINPIFTEIAFPLMAHIQHDKGALSSTYLKGVLLLNYANAPLYFGLAILAHPVIFLFLGNQWTNTASIVEILAISYLLRANGNPVGSLLLATGRTARGFVWNFALLLVAPLLIVIGLYADGLRGVAWSTLVIQLLMFFPIWSYLVWPACSASLGSYVRASMRPWIIALGSTVLSAFLTERADEAIYRLVLFGSLAVPLYAFLISCLDPKAWRAISGILQK